MFEGVLMQGAPRDAKSVAADVCDQLRLYGCAARFSGAISTTVIAAASILLSI
jgi:hypothetical protein